LGVIGIRELARIADSQQARVRRALVGIFIVGTIIGNWSFYSVYYHTMNFHIPRLVAIVEQMAGTNVISGSGLQDLDYSPKLNIVWNFELTDRAQDCEEIRKAYPTPDKTPQFIGWGVSNDPSKFDEGLRPWYAACPEWKKQYQVHMMSQRIDYNGAVDVWMVRTNVQLTGTIPLIQPPIIR
jgi:hypothetical protein